MLESDLEGLASSLAFLHRVGLHPVVVHGAGPQLTQELQLHGLPNEHRDGLRVTTPEVLEIARRVFVRENLRLVDALERMRAHARPITSGVFEAAALDATRYGLVGQVTGIRLDQIQSSLRAGQLPIVACLGETAGGQILNLSADLAARELAAVVQPHKIVFLTNAGGLFDESGQLISAINLDEEYENLLREPWSNERLREQVRAIKRTLDGLPSWASVSITSPEHLAKELFTHKGSGTLLRKGERVQRLDSFSGIDLQRLQQLLEECFGKTLVPGYFTDKTPYRIYLTESYRATALLTTEGPIPYLDKFAVTQQAQRIGLGATLWHRMRQENPRVFWRSRRDNPVNSWYFEQAEGAYKSERWTVFWYGLSQFNEIQSCVERALAMPATLTESARS